jgi:hypothetical protein
MFGLLAGFGAEKYQAEKLNSEMVAKGSYVLQSDIAKSYVPMERFMATSQELQATKAERDGFRQLYEGLKETQSAMTVSVCQRYAAETDSLAHTQEQTERSIQAIRTPTLHLFGKETDEQVADDEKRVKELQRYSAELNQQLMQLRELSSKCAK